MLPQIARILIELNLRFAALCPARNLSMSSDMQGSMADSSASAPIPALRHRWESGDDVARNKLFTVVYQQVHPIAQRAKSGATINPTELSNEALIRMLGSDANYENRRHFFGVVATATRQVLIRNAFEN